jgi:hypothetical protein
VTWPASIWNERFIIHATRLYLDASGDHGVFPYQKFDETHTNSTTPSRKHGVPNLFPMRSFKAVTSDGKSEHKHRFPATLLRGNKPCPELKTEAPTFMANALQYELHQFNLIWSGYPWWWW